MTLNPIVLLVGAPACTVLGIAIGVALVREQVRETILREQMVLRFEAANDAWLAEHQERHAIAATPHDVTGELLAIRDEPEPEPWSDDQRAAFAAAVQSAIRHAYATRRDTHVRQARKPAPPPVGRHRAPVDKDALRALTTSTMAMPVLDERVLAGVR